MFSALKPELIVSQLNKLTAAADDDDDDDEEEDGPQAPSFHMGVCRQTAQGAEGAAPGLEERWHAVFKWTLEMSCHHS